MGTRQARWRRRGTVRGGTTRIGGSWQSGQGENFEGADKTGASLRGLLERRICPRYLFSGIEAQLRVVTEVALSSWGGPWKMEESTDLISGRLDLPLLMVMDALEFGMFSPSLKS
jgi:hypothetical protein